MSRLTDFKFIDIHYHANPDLYVRRHDALQTGELYQSLTGAVVLKSHLGSTSIQATLAQNAGLPVFPSLVLNSIAGGIDYRVIMQALSEYQPVMAAKMIVHFPTITGRAFQSKLPRTLAHPHLSEYSQQGLTLFDDHYCLRNEVIDIVKLANDYPIILSTGHASKEEVYALIDACIQFNVQALLLNQPAHPLMGFDATALKTLAQNELVWIEQTALTYVLGHQDKDDFAQVLTNLPRVIYSSDLGQLNQMDVTEWLVFTQRIFAELGLSEERCDEVMRLNAAELLESPSS